ncbi:hypothetical protein FRC00_008076 [Tulasnella sp. 408]|nr:hypothetical protein FRC00_008076 [Tulasnella sp. 408]
MARVWIIVWEDGTLSHNLPPNIATDVEDYCQLQHSLKANSSNGNSGRSRPQKPKAQRNKNQSGTATWAQKQQPTSNNSIQPLPTPVTQLPPKPPTSHAPQNFSALNALSVSNPAATLTATSSQQPATRAAPSLPTLSQVPKAPPVARPAQTTQYTAQSTLQAPQAPKTWATLALKTPSQADRPISRVETIPTRPKVYVPPKKMATTLRVLDQFHWKDSYEYEKVSKAGSAGRSFKRFGPGVYTSTVSSKSYAEHKVVLVAKVALGRESVHYQTTQELTEPPYGYDSVLGEVGIDLNYDEQVLYKDEAIRPAYVVVYEEPIPVPKVSTVPTTTTTTTRPRPAPTQSYTTYNPFPSTTTTTRPTQATTTGWFGSTATTTTTNSSSSSGCIIM